MVLKYFDLFGYDIRFFYKTKEKFQTNFGGFLTILLGFTLITLFYILGQDDFYKKNPHSVYQEFPIQKDYSIKLKKNEFIGGIGIFGYLREINGKILKPNFFLNKFIQENKIKRLESTKINAVSCDKLNFNLDFKKEIFDLSNYYCPDFTDIDLSISGSFNSKILKYLTMEITSCDFEGNCSTEDEINDLYKDQIIVSIIYPQVYYNKENYENPLELKLNSHFNILDKNKNLLEDLHLSNNIVINSETINLLYEKQKYEKVGAENIKYIQSFRHSDQGGKLNYYIKNEKKYFEINFRLGETKHIHFRTYKSLVDTIAQVNGIFIGLRYLISFLIFPISKFYFHQYLCNELTLQESLKDLEDLKTINENIKIKQLAIKKLINKNNTNLLSNSGKINFSEMSSEESPKKVEIKNKEKESKFKNAPLGIVERKDNYLDSIDEDEFKFKKDKKKDKEKDIEKETDNLTRNNQIIENIFEKRLRKINKEEEIFNLSIWMWLGFTKRDKFYSLFKIFNKKIDKHFDIIKYLKGNHEIKMIRKIILNPIQDELISLIAKKPYKVDATKEEVDYEKFHKDKGIDKLVKYINKEERSEYDKEIFINFFKYDLN